MKTEILLFILGAHLPVLTALFVVTAPKSSYTASYGNNVMVECRFPVAPNFNANQLKVYWHHILDDGSSQEVYKLFNGKEVLQDQLPEYRERAFLLWDELHSGRAVLKISQVRVSDAGTYRCLIDLNGVDYKETALKVIASYEDIQTVTTTEKKETELICQSAGYPLATVTWLYRNGSELNKTANTTYFIGTNGLYNIRSVLRVQADINDTFVCRFWNKELNKNTSAALHIAATEKEREEADDFPSSMRSYIILVLIAPMMIFAALLLLLLRTIKSRQLSEKSTLQPLP
ncbi:programmed cell death 1 ligand 1 [Callorhinchus milii]|uniref:Programmed cell death 1 ligand 1 n=1 Tax=Callorhinchus milii TaxID=7868 RepID=V9KYU4_CALMI|nr:programmed cell death 1 ligand 1 [Callorhinchus milii]|eukprot:gi/632949514/ref/XP_007890197.1/ PREDICTED: programmed cell death 1 ligand 1 [Callorhinchus milii]